MVESANENVDDSYLDEEQDNVDRKNSDEEAAMPGTLKKEGCASLPRLERRAVRDLIALVVAYACTFGSTTMIVGSSALVVKSVGGSNGVAPFALGAFFVGSAFVSLLTSHLYETYGRKVGFIVGNSFGLLGAGLGGIGVWVESPTLVIASSIPLGAANGIGMHLRFAAVEVVPPSAKAFAVTLVLSGGCLAAFAGPESSMATRDLFGEGLDYLGLYMMIAIFNIVNAFSVGVVEFPKLCEAGASPKLSDTTQTNLVALLRHRKVLLPMLTAILSWTIMALPMSIVRVAMRELGYTSRESLIVTEIHFLGMYAPGFVTGKVIDWYGTTFTNFASIIFFSSAMVFNLVSESNDVGSIGTWITGMITIGIGWNLGFSCSTVMLTRGCAMAPEFKMRIQAANDFFMFLLSGSMIFSTGYIYEAGGGMLSGWRTVNLLTVGLVMLMSFILFTYFLVAKKLVVPRCFCTGRDACHNEAIGPLQKRNSHKTSLSGLVLGSLEDVED